MANKKVGIDIGSRSIGVYLEGRGVILREPTQIALDINTKEPISYGQEAIGLSRRTPGSVIMTSPVFEGSITDYPSMGLILDSMFRANGLVKSDMVISLNSAVNDAEKRAVAQMFFEAGAKSLSCLDIPTACVLGSGESLSDNRATISLDIGAGVTEVGLVKGCVTKFSQVVKYGCAKLDASIAALIKKKYNAGADEATLRMIREKVGSVHPSFDAGEVSFSARDLVTGLPVTLSISSAETAEAMEPIAKYIAAFTAALCKSLPDGVKEEVTERGILISGGGALTGGMDTLVSEATGMPVRVSKAATDCVIRGIGTVIENMNVFGVLLKEI